MRPVQPQQLQSQTRGEAVSLGKAPSPAPAHLPVSGVKDLALFPQKNMERSSPATEEGMEGVE